MGVDTDTARQVGSRWQLQLLGEFQLRSGTTRIGLGGVQQRLLAFLVLQRRAVAREVVSGSLWPESGSDAGAALRNAVWRLRKAAPGVLVASREHLRVADGLTVDLDRAHEVARQLVPAPSRPPPPAVVSLLGDDLLPDWQDDWVVVERERFRRLRLHALEVAAQALTTVARFAEAINAATLAVDAEPLRESAHRVLIRAHIAEGNWSEALQQYERCRRVLDEELGIGPTPALESLVARSTAGAVAAGGGSRR